MDIDWREFSGDRKRDCRGMGSVFSFDSGTSFLPHLYIPLGIVCSASENSALPRAPPEQLYLPQYSL